MTTFKNLKFILNLCFIGIIFLSFTVNSIPIHTSTGKDDHGNGNTSTDSNHNHAFINIDFQRVGHPIVISLWVFLVCISLTGNFVEITLKFIRVSLYGESFQYYPRILVNQSCFVSTCFSLLILLGIPIGLIDL